MRMESPLNQRLRRSPPDVVYTPIDVTSLDIIRQLDLGQHPVHPRVSGNTIAAIISPICSSGTSQYIEPDLSTHYLDPREAFCSR